MDSGCIYRVPLKLCQSFPLIRPASWMTKLQPRFAVAIILSDDSPTGRKLAWLDKEVARRDLALMMKLRNYTGTVANSI